MGIQVISFLKENTKNNSTRRSRAQALLFGEGEYCPF